MSGSTRKIIGIDPGQKGGIAVFYVDYPVVSGRAFVHEQVYSFSMQDYIRELEAFDSYADRLIIEKQWSRPTDGGVGAFKAGTNYGKLLGAAEVFGIDPILVTPGQWKKEFDLMNSKLSYKEKKLKDIEKAKELFPSINLLPTTRCKKESDGMADALLIAEFGRRYYV